MKYIIIIIYNYKLIKYIMSIKIQVISDLHLEFLKVLPKLFRQKLSQKPQFVKASYLFLADSQIFFYQNPFYV